MDIKVNQILENHMKEMQLEKKQNVQPDFNFTLQRIDSKGLEKRLTALVGDITVQGEKLSKSMDIGDLKKYRSMVSEFIKEVVTNSHEFSRENFLDRRGRHRVYGIVRKVDAELDNLAKEVLAQEKDNLKILDKTGEIRGLLLDIFV